MMLDGKYCNTEDEGDELTESDIDFREVISNGTIGNENDDLYMKFDSLLENQGSNDDLNIKDYSEE